MRTLRVRTSDELPSCSGEGWLERIRAAVRASEPLKDYGEQASTITYRAPLGGGEDVWIKEYRTQSKVKKLLSVFRRSRADRVWWISGQLRSCGCEVPRPHLMLDLRFAGVLRESYLVTEWLEGRTSLADWFRARGEKAAEGNDWEDTVFHAVRAAAGFHRHGAIHGDMKWSNFMLPPDSEGEIVLIDLDATRFDSSPGARGKDLARFAVSALEQGLEVDIMDRIFDVYCGSPRPPQAERIRRAYERYVRKRLPHKFR